MNLPAFLQRLITFQSTPEAAVAAALAMAASPNGFERQHGVETLGRLQPGLAIPVLLWRSNDWVPSVRQAAQNALLRSFLDETRAAAYAQDWVNALESIQALRRARRHRHDALLSRIDVHLAHPALQPAMRRALETSAPAVQRDIADRLWTNALTTAARIELIEHLLSSRDIVLARRAVRWMADPGISDDDKLRLLTLAGRSAFASVRIEALRCMLQQAAQPAISALIEEMCLDTSDTARAVATRAVREQGRTAVVEARALAVWHDPSRPDRVRASALSLLCNLDGAAGQVLCRQVGADQPPRLRQAARACLLRHVQPGEREALWLSCLADPSARVQRLAVAAIHDCSVLPDLPTMLDIGFRHGTSGALRRILGVLCFTDAWTRLDLVLEAWQRAEMNPALARVCLGALETWCAAASRNFLSPTAAQRTSLLHHWHALDNTLPSPLREQVERQLTWAGLIGPHQSC